MRKSTQKGMSNLPKITVLGSELNPGGWTVEPSFLTTCPSVQHNN